MEGTGAALDMKSRPRLPEELERNIGALASAIRFRVAMSRLSSLAVALAAFFFCDLALDRFFRFDRPQRALILATSLAALARYVYVRFVRSGVWRPDAESLSLEIEKRDPGFQSALISAVQFCRVGPDMARASNVSIRMMEETVRQAAGAVSGRHLTDMLDPGRFRRHLLAGGASLGLILAFSAAFPSVAGIWFLRNVLLSTADWPRRCRLQVMGVEGNALKVPRGDDLSVVVRADPSGEMPEHVFVRYRSASSWSWGEMQMTRAGEGEYVAEFKGVMEPFRFYACGGDGITPECPVEVVERPALKCLRLTAFPPAYTGRPPMEMAMGESVFHIPAGSGLRIAGSASKPLRSAALRLGGKDLTAMSLSGVMDVSAEIAPDDLASGTCEIALKDEDGLEAKPRPRFALKIVPDRAPAVRVAMNGIGDMVTPEASIPLEIEIRDDYGVASCHVVYFAPSAESPPRTLAAVEKFPPGKTEVGRFEYRLDVEPLKLQPGAHLAFRIEARDNDSLRGPNVGMSNSFSLKVVSPDELLSEMIRREQEQRQEFERLIADQKACRDSVAAVAERPVSGGSPPPGASQDMLAGERRQRQLARRADAVAGQFARILAEMENNKLATDLIRRRLKSGIIGPLRELAAGPMTGAADRLDAARRSAADPKTGPAALKSAVELQDRSLERMREILKQMLKWEGYHEAVNMLRDVMKLQEDVRKETIEEHKRRIRKMFE
ncbi:MAG: DUF4175 domain-containing protein [Planctomycetota bacterium]|nr:DUF4175 domain-containing protein [Planctomycetota bacterium]